LNIDWDSEEETELFSSSLHIAINAEAKTEYDAWVKEGCESLWWWKKEQRRRLKIGTCMA